MSMEAGPTQGPARDRGYTFVTKSVFRNKSDMDFYEKECPAHEGYKAFLRENAPVEDLTTVCFSPEVTFAL
ncbi:hypothetical protein A1O1_02870 [Capronia coronata CBS 617.96]|uniref:Stress-response A/B barrel domain-containing protein n=1 Tax=Capronia coronata CBS 617.96 TaxID=1182541 RepID=W9ZJ04_9EURO|nr:uncharacterized protein A1O1_02870 [Capronia coronata CBS 617.96]EXJ94474.1 hypothetical protein A1O1_02870 [Capronia coronata CBS 617.96]